PYGISAPMRRSARALVTTNARICRRIALFRGRFLRAGPSPVSRAAIMASLIWGGTGEPNCLAAQPDYGFNLSAASRPDNGRRPADNRHVFYRTARIPCPLIAGRSWWPLRGEHRAIRLRVHAVQPCTGMAEPRERVVSFIAFPCESRELRERAS